MDGVSYSLPFGKFKVKLGFMWKQSIDAASATSLTYFYCPVLVFSFTCLDLKRETEPIPWNISVSDKVEKWKLSLRPSFAQPTYEKFGKEIVHQRKDWVVGRNVFVRQRPQTIFQTSFSWRECRLVKLYVSGWRITLYKNKSLIIAILYEGSLIKLT